MKIDQPGNLFALEGLLDLLMEDVLYEHQKAKQRGLLGCK
jgi:hypothetical protein